MKKKVLAFICSALFLLTVVPAINLSLDKVQKKSGEKFWSRSKLYNIDFLLIPVSRFFYPLGISIDPNRVIIGKEGWLYLGDLFNNAVTIRRRGVTFGQEKYLSKIGVDTKMWSRKLKCDYGAVFKIMLGPDKETIYPEFLPSWMQSTEHSATDVLLAEVGSDILVDTRPDLKAAKADFPEPLYYKTDTHWNTRGAWIAFRAFSRNVAGTEKNLRWLSDKQVRFVASERSGGDLTKFLFMNDVLRDMELSVEIDTVPSIETEHYDFDTGRLVQSGGNDLVLVPRRPLLVKSKHALNQKKVLWLRDSFGTAVAPFMHATFYEVLQINHEKTDPVLFSKMLKAFKPDYVFVTRVERVGSTWNLLNQPL